jgi:hypothetical protein
MVSFTSVGMEVSVDDGSGVADAVSLVAAGEEILVEDAEMMDDELEAEAKEDGNDCTADEDVDMAGSVITLEGADAAGAGLELGDMVE